MNIPDLAIEVSQSDLTALLPVNGRLLSKHFSRSYSGLADLLAWMRDRGMKECFIRIRCADKGLFSSVVNLAAVLGLGGHFVSIGGSHRCKDSSAARGKTNEAASV